MNKALFFLGISVVSLLAISTSCKQPVRSVVPSFVFKHYLNGYELEQGQMKYTNMAGNLYEVDELQYFISEITFKTSDGRIIPIETDNAIHYIDINDSSTLDWIVLDRLPVTDYDSISFVFGISKEKNKTGLFVNPPERDMFWPEMMGGGYHYMKMNGKWMSLGDQIKPFNFHIGIGLEEDKITLVQNYFIVSLPLHIHTGSLSNQFTISMDIEKWFESPNYWDWDLIGGQIMQNQDAMHKACENGRNAFRVSNIATDIVWHD